MANPFLVTPAIATKQAQGGLSALGGAIGESMKQKKALEKEQAMQAELQAAFQSGDPLKMAEMSLKYPQMKTQIDGAMGIRNKIQLDDFRDSAIEFLSAPDNASKRDVLVRRIERIQARGGDATQSIQSLADFDANPDAEIAEIKTLFAGRLPNEYKALYPESQEARIGTYNPRDYTASSFAEFKKTGDPAKLERYTEKTIDVGGVPHVLTADGTYKAISSTEDVAASKSKIESALVKAREETKADVAKRSSEIAQSGKVEAATQIVDELLASDLDKIYGKGESVIPGFLRSQKGVDMMAKRDRIVAMLQMAARGELKGQGPITEGEQGMLSRSATLLAEPDISPELARRELEDALKAIKASAGRGKTTQTERDLSGIPADMAEWIWANPDDPRVDAILAKARGNN